MTKAPALWRRRWVASKMVGAILGVAFATIGISAAALPNDWPSRQKLDVPTPGLMRVELSPETFDSAQASLADLRLLDAAGVEIPFLISQPLARTRNLRPQEGWQVFLEENRTRIEIDVNVRGRLRAISLETPAVNFLKAASVTGTSAGASRILFSNHPVFRQPAGATQLHFKLPDDAWTHLTLILDDTRSRPVPITGLVLREEEAALSPPETVAVRLGERIEGSGETRLTIDLGAARVPLAGLRIHTDAPLFVRPVNVLTRQWTNGEIRERSLGGGIIYRTAVDGQPPAAQVELAIDVKSPTRELVLVIDNGDSPPLPIESVEVFRRPTHLVFLARQAGTLQLLSGNPRAVAPRYDVSALSSELKSAKATLLKPGPLEANPAFRPSEPLPEIPVLAAALDVQPWSFRRPVQTMSGSVQQLELTPHVLAHAQAGLGDLRLVAAGRQVPFILERAGFTRSLSLEVVRADDPKRPQLSRWTIRLPQARLPVSQLSCETKAALFQREVRLMEEVVNGRGERHPRTLGHATWLRRPEGKSGRFAVALTTPPQSDTLVLEIENGDNPAVELEGFQASLPVVRMLFKAPPEATVELCYGNASALAPNYDLDLVAPQILSAARSEAKLIGADPVGPGARRSESGSVSLVFYGVLVLVVAGLVVVIMRLLPKPAVER